VQNQEFAVMESSRQASVLDVRSSGKISSVERARAFWQRVERYDCGDELCSEDRSGSDRWLVIVSGWACELRILPDGRRQIFGFLLPCDTIEARATTGGASHGVMALTRLEVVSPCGPGTAEGLGEATMLRALEAEALRREDRFYDQLTRIGRLTARERIMHLLLELYCRLARVGLVNGDTFKLPLTQEIFADALGLSIAHINRTLKELRREGLVVIQSGRVTLPDRERLAVKACYLSVDGGPLAVNATPQRPAYSRAGVAPRHIGGVGAG
jgi:CRP-like cAMP-binding protein